MYKISLVFWIMGELGILLSRFTDLYQFSSFKLKNWTHTRVCVDILQVTSVIERSSIGKMEELENCPCLNELHQALRWSVVWWLGGLSCIFLSADSDECLVQIIRYEFCCPLELFSGQKIIRLIKKWISLSMFTFNKIITTRIQISHQN